jgi:hypothetical protein
MSKADVESFDVLFNKISDVPDSKGRAELMITAAENLKGVMLGRAHAKWEAERRVNPYVRTPVAEAENPTLRRFLELCFLSNQILLDEIDRKMVIDVLDEVIESSLFAVQQREPRPSDETLEVVLERIRACSRACPRSGRLFKRRGEADPNDLQ